MSDDPSLVMRANNARAEGFREQIVLTPPLEAGRELDALVAEKVLGCKVYTCKRHDGEVIRYRCDCAKGTPETPPHSDDFVDHTVKPYSRAIGAAWDVVEHMLAGGQYFKLYPHCWNAPPSWVVKLDGHGEVWGRTAPEAICLAALLAVG